MVKYKASTIPTPCRVISFPVSPPDPRPKSSKIPSILLDWDLNQSFPPHLPKENSQCSTNMNLLSSVQTQIGLLTGEVNEYADEEIQIFDN